MAHDADLGERGFTLLELMITLAVMAVLAVIAIPSYKGLTQRNALATAANSLVGSLYFARGQAIMQGHPVVLCKSADGIDCSDSGGWDQGWIIYAALEGLKTTEPDEGNRLRVYPALRQGISITGNTNVAKSIAFRPSGFPYNKSGSFANGTLTASWGARSDKMEIVIAPTGHVRIE